ncbi:MAG: ribonuclease Z [Candidatus Woesearchaeota archaeon]
MQIIILGTSCMVPTKERNVSATYLEFEGEGMLFDCGEGTQRQMAIAGLSRQKVKKVFISHWHADHVAGLLGLIQTIGNLEKQRLDIYGPVGTKERLDHLLAATYFDLLVDLQVHEISQKAIVVQKKKYEIHADILEHGIPCVGFCFIEKERLRIDMQKAKALGLEQGPLLAELQQGKDVTHGKKTIRAKDVTFTVAPKKFAYIGDTVYCQQAVDLCQDADVAIIESTYAKEHENRAQEYFHLTSEQAAQIANAANVGALYLTHVSQRYKDATILEEQAKLYFENTKLAHDFMKIKL